MSSPVCSIRGLGMFAPERILTNAELERMVDTSDEWITTRTGIKERRIVAPGEMSSDLALRASRQALDQAGITADALTHILVATLTPDSYVPSTACVLEHKLGTSGKVAFDLNAACSGFTYAMEQSRAICALHPAATILVVGVEILSQRTNWADRGTCVLFGDGAGAVVLSGADQPRGLGQVRDVLLSSDGSLGSLLTVKGGASSSPYQRGQVVADEYFIHMEGREVYKHAVRSMAAITEAMLTKHGLTVDDVDLFIPHQANLRIIEGLAKRFNLPDHKVFHNVERYGNTSAATVPMALSEAHAAGRLPPGSTAILATFGGGFTWGSSLLTFGDVASARQLG